MRRTLILTLALFLLLTACARAEDDFRDGLYRYTLLPDGSARIIDYDGVGPTLDIPSALGGHPVTVIGSRAFSRNKNLVTLDIPEGVTVLEEQAFAECAGAETAALPDLNFIGRVVRVEFTL